MDEKTDNSTVEVRPLLIYNVLFQSTKFFNIWRLVCREDDCNTVEPRSFREAAKKTGFLVARPFFLNFFFHFVPNLK